MAKEEVIQEIKNCIVDCMSLIDTENVDGCIDRMLNLCHKLKTNNLFDITDNLFDLTNKIMDRFDVRVQKLNNLVDFIEATLRYTEGFDSTGAPTNYIVDYIANIAKVEALDEMDRCYILTKIIKDKRVTCYAAQIVTHSLFKSIEW